MVAVFIHLDDTTPENGGLCVYPGSHKLGPQEDKGVEERGEKYHYLDQVRSPFFKYELVFKICDITGVF